MAIQRLFQSATFSQYPVLPLILSAVALCLIIRFAWQFVLETVIHYALVIFNPGTLSAKKSIRGPKWQLPNGHVIDKFMYGRIKSDEWRKKYGSVYRIWAGPHPEIVITTPQQLRNLHTDNEKHGKPTYSNLGWYLGQVLGSCIGLLDGSAWKKNRQIFDKPFTHSATVPRAETTNNAARDFVQKLSHGATKHGDSETFSHEIVQAFQKYPFYVTARVIYGDMTASEEAALWELAKRRLELMPYLFIGGPYRYKFGGWFDRKAFKLLDDFKQEWRNFNEGIAQVRRARGIHAPIVSWWDACNAGTITMENLLHTLDEMLMANLDVTTHVVTWLITLIADNENVKQELLDEIGANWDRLDEYITATNTHLHRCFQECLRVRSPLMFTAGESSPSVKEFDGILVKPNTMVLVDVLAINVRNPFWGEMSESFNPSRFKSIKPSDLRYNMVMFGFGGRKCPGNYFGAQMCKALIVHLFQQYEVGIVGGRMGDNTFKTDEADWIAMSHVTIRLTKMRSSI